jgi:hypothetical protein
MTAAATHNDKGDRKVRPHRNQPEIESLTNHQ